MGRVGVRASTDRLVLRLAHATRVTLAAVLELGLGF